MSTLSLALTAITNDLRLFVHDIDDAAKQDDVLELFNPWRVFILALNIAYILCQVLLIYIFKPAPPESNELKKPFGRIAVIGAGLTGISSAAHAIAHNFEVVIYEASDRPGGIWAHVNKTSGLQINSLIYRFHPAVLWSCAYPLRDEILSEIKRVWKEYKLESRTRMNTRVTSVTRASGTTSPGARWVVNDGRDGEFDAVIVTVGTCGQPMMVPFKGMPEGKLQPKDNSVEKGKEEDAKRDEDTKRRGLGRRENESRRDDEVHAADLDPRDEGAPSFADIAKHPPMPVPVPPASLEEDKSGPSQSQNVQGEEARLDDTHNESHVQDESKHSQEGDNGVFAGQVLHSSELDDADIEGKTVLVIGSGASGVEAVETALQRGAKEPVLMVARDDKWIIPRNIVVDTSISAQPFGREMPLSFLWETFLKVWHYRSAGNLVPVDKGIYEGTPIVNDKFLHHVRCGCVKYVRGDTLRLTKRGARVRVRPRGSKSGSTGPAGQEEGQDYPIEEFEGDVVVLSTGFKKPDVDFLPKDLFPKDYERPDLYLQNFSTEDWSVLLTNSAYVNAIGTVGHFHIGIYTRILLMFLLDKDARPPPKDMKLWVDALRFVKRGARGGALGFFTYMELTIWFLMFHVFRPNRLRWIFFVMQGWGLNVNKVGE
ncbi:hypothetical protein EW146_g6535 [Bondarzewia mesenterica]|uniref:FAD/NAD(P)-binding domain-containing protein n=1 Tax=Bondarzewia mesenterica TaxID=1095465 RepID=A0A4S4LNB1_9AGAM|nr:hypothetical protein EW146_g6535 [Bondarzewia mesenterica]